MPPSHGKGRVTNHNNNKQSRHSTGIVGLVLVSGIHKFALNRIIFMYVQLLQSVVLFCSDRFICKPELSEALNCFQKRTFFLSDL